MVEWRAGWEEREEETCESLCKVVVTVLLSCTKERVGSTVVLDDFGSCVLLDFFFVCFVL